MVVLKELTFTGMYFKNSHLSSINAHQVPKNSTDVAILETENFLTLLLHIRSFLLLEFPAKLGRQMDCRHQVNL